MVETPYEGDMGMARLSWEHIDDDQWNGRRYGYYVSGLLLSRNVHCLVKCLAG